MGEHPSWAANGVPPGEPFKGKTYRADGWAYQDFPKCAPKLWNEIIDAIGEENIVPLSFANYGRSCRGQLVISPSGMANLADYMGQASNHPTTPGDSHD